MIIFEPPFPLVYVPTIAFAISYGTNGVATTLPQTCTVWKSYDNQTYEQIGSFAGPSREGMLTAALPAYTGTNPDTGDTLSISTAKSAAVFNSVSATAAAAADSLCVIQDGTGTVELLSYKTATLTGTNAYNLTTLYRGLYGTTAIAHQTNAKFAAYDTNILTLPLDPADVGRLLYLKFPTSRGTAQTLSQAAAFEYVPQGTGYLVGMLPVTGGYALAPTSSLTVLSNVFTLQVAFPVNFARSVATVQVPATSTATFNVQKNGSNVGTVTFAAGAYYGTFAVASETTFGQGDTLTIVAPGSPDATLAGVSFALYCAPVTPPVPYFPLSTDAPLASSTARRRAAIAAQDGLGRGAGFVYPGPLPVQSA